MASYSSKAHEIAAKWKDQLVDITPGACTWSPATGWIAGYDDFHGVLIEPSNPGSGWNIQNAGHSGKLWGISNRPKPKRGYWVMPDQILGLATAPVKLTAREIAERFKGQVLQVRKDYNDPIYDANKDERVFEARIIGFRESSNEVMGSPVHDDLDTCWKVAQSGYKNHVIVDPTPKYGWWFKVDAFIIPTGQTTKGVPSKKDIPPWPHVCPGCKGPALHMGTTMVDCKAACKPQYTYRSGR